jgi:hypothetical protein
MEAPAEMCVRSSFESYRHCHEGKNNCIAADFKLNMGKIQYKFALQSQQGILVKTREHIFNEK